MKVHRFHVDAMNDWARRETEQQERRTPNEERHRINEWVMRRPKAGPAQQRPRVSRQQPKERNLGPWTDWWGGDKNAITGAPRTMLHFVMKHYVYERQLRHF